METRWKLAITIVLSLALGACSGSKKADDEEAGSDETISADAGTDAVPKDQVESLPDPDKAAKGGDSGLESLPTDDSKKTAEAAPPAADAPADSAPAAPAVASGETMNYTVQAGDTLMKIAFETYGDLYQWRKIYDLNRDKVPEVNRLSKGTVRKIEKPASAVSIDRNGEKYLIKTGDTLASISDDVYGTRKKWQKLHENNKQMIKDPNKIYAGFYLYYLMSDQDRQEKEQFMQNKGSAPLAGGGAAPTANTVQAQPAAAAPPAQAPLDGGLIDATGTAGEARAPSSAPAK